MFLRTAVPRMSCFQKMTALVRRTGTDDFGNPGVSLVARFLSGGERGDSTVTVDRKLLGDLIEKIDRLETLIAHQNKMQRLEYARGPREGPYELQLNNDLSFASEFFFEVQDDKEKKHYEYFVDAGFYGGSQKFYRDAALGKGTMVCYTAKPTSCSTSTVFHLCNFRA